MTRKGKTGRKKNDSIQTKAIKDVFCSDRDLSNEARDAKVDICLSNSFGFGGQNDTLVIKRI